MRGPPAISIFIRRDERPVISCAPQVRAAMTTAEREELDRLADNMRAVLEGVLARVAA